VAVHTRNEIRGIGLCSGYGGLELGVEIAIPEYRAVCHVEREAHAAASLVARMEDKALASAPVWDDLRSFDGRAWRGKVHLITAGYPCQPFSNAGKRRGAADPRHLWPEVARIIDEVRPPAVFVENVEGHINLGFADVIGQLRGLGYEPKAGLFSAREAGASHRRRRLFILAYSDGSRRRLRAGYSDRPGRDQFRKALLDPNWWRPISTDECGPRLDSYLDVDGGIGFGGDPKGIFAPGPAELAAWRRVLSQQPAAQPALLRTDHGLADELERTRGAGNGVCSLVAALALTTLDAAFSNE
jgi:DNA (cytosine-5)-methyltransferase 1